MIPRPGKVVLRGPAKITADLTAHAPLNLMGAVGVAGGVMLATRATNALDPCQVPRIGQVATTSQAATTMFSVGTGGSVASVTVTRNTAPGFQWINFDGLLYGISADATGTAVHDTNTNYSMPPLNLLTLPDTVGTAAPTVLSGAPTGALDLAGHLSRIWLLGGVDTPGSATTHSSTSLFFTNPIASGGGGSASDWKDPVSGLTNLIVMDKDAHDPGVGLAKIHDGLLVFRRRSVWIIRGTTSASFTSSMVTADVGCIDPRSIVEADQGVYFLSDRGLMLTNGLSVRDVSGPARYTLQRAATAALATAQTAGECTFQCAMLSDGQIVVSFIAAPTASSTSTPIWCGCYDPATGAWWRLTSPLWTHDAGPGLASTTNVYPGTFVTYKPFQTVVSVGDKFVTQLENFHGGASSIVGPRDADIGWFDDNNSAAGFSGGRYISIPALWRTRNMPLGTSGRKRAQAKRFYLDYVSQSHVNTDGWSVQAVTPDFAQRGPSVPAAGLVNSLSPPSSSMLSGGATYGLSKTLQRMNQDFAWELDDVAFEVTRADVAATDTAPPNAAFAELYGLGVEFQATSDLR